MTGGGEEGDQGLGGRDDEEVREYLSEDIKKWSLRAEPREAWQSSFEILFRDCFVTSFLAMTRQALSPDGTDGIDGIDRID